MVTASGPGTPGALRKMRARLKREGHNPEPSGERRQHSGRTA